MSKALVFLWLFAACNMVDHNKQITIHGHRGCRGLMPENTMPGFYKALDMGAEALEIDLVCTADGRMLISHDPYMLSEICTKPDGSLIAKEEEQSLNIYKMSLAEAQTYHCGTLPIARFPQQQLIKSHKPSFIEFVVGIKEYCHSKNIAFPLLNIEIKSEPEWDSIFQPEPHDYTNLFLDEFNHLQLEKKALVQSFDPRILESIHRKQPELKLMLLIGGESKDVKPNLEALTFKPYAYNPHFSLVDENVVQYCNENNLELMVWTVNEKADIERMVELGVQHIITDYPDRAKEVLLQKANR